MMRSNLHAADQCALQVGAAGLGQKPPVLRQILFPDIHKAEVVTILVGGQPPRTAQATLRRSDCEPDGRAQTANPS
jgi:hypothetical protein